MHNVLSIAMQPGQWSVMLRKWGATQVALPRACQPPARGIPPLLCACLGATRDVLEGTVGYAYRIYAGPAGKVQYGLQYSYISRKGWTGLGGAPKAVENQFYTSFRYYIP